MARATTRQSRRQPWLCIGVILLGVLSGCASDPVAPPAGLDPAMVWLQHQPAALPRTEVATAAVGAVLYAIGGYAPSGLAANNVQAFHAAEERWMTAAPYPVPIHHTAAVAHGGQVYVLGGYTTPAFVPTDLGFVYDPGSGLWTPLPRLPTVRGAHAAAILDGSIYLMGGVGADGELIEAVDVLHIGSLTWTTAAPLPTPRDHLAAAAMDGYVYAVGGRLEDPAANLATLERYDPGRKAWTGLADLPTPRGGLAAANWGGLLVAVGGESPSNTHGEVEGYDPATDEWTALAPLPTPRHGLGAAVAGDRLYTLLGGPEPGLATSDVIESLGLVFEL